MTPFGRFRLPVWRHPVKILPSVDIAATSATRPSIQGRNSTNRDIKYVHNYFHAMIGTVETLFIGEPSISLVL